jgi:signal transduction histidine kinase
LQVIYTYHFCCFLSYCKYHASSEEISEIKNDFINNMTHEFKTPLATISLAVDAMKNDKVLVTRKT